MWPLSQHKENQLSAKQLPSPVDKKGVSTHSVQNIYEKEINQV